MWEEGKLAEEKLLPQTLIVQPQRWGLHVPIQNPQSKVLKPLDSAVHKARPPACNSITLKSLKSISQPGTAVVLPAAARIFCFPKLLFPRSEQNKKVAKETHLSMVLVSSQRGAAYLQIQVTSNKSSVADKRSMTYNMEMQLASN